MSRTQMVLSDFKISKMFYKGIVLLLVSGYYICGTTAFGFTYPSEIEAEVGKTFRIYCTINLAESRELNSSSLNFSFSDRNDDILKYYEDIPPPKFNTTITILNETTIVAEVKTYSAMHYGFICKLNENGVAETDVKIGTKPKPVSNFRCRSYNHENLSCSFEKPFNPIATTFNLSYNIPIQYKQDEETSLDYFQESKCELAQYSNRTYACHLVSPYFRRNHKEHNFLLLSKNIFGNLTEVFPINHYKLVVPKPPYNLSSIVSTNSVNLTWYISTKLNTFDDGFIHQINITSEFDSQEIENLNFAFLGVDNIRINYSKHLLVPYANAWYTVGVRIKARYAMADIDELWSPNATIRFKTLPKLPDKPPTVDIGSFYINDNHDISIFWKELPRSQRNHDHTYYVVETVSYPDKNETVRAKYNSMFTDLKDYEFRIRTKNPIGFSNEFSKIVVPSAQKRIQRPERLKLLYDGEYIVSWKKPENENRITSYTVFWCKSTNKSPDSCSNNINFVQVDKNTFEYHYKSTESINFAVSANSFNSSSGMVWTKCKSSKDNDIGKVTTFYLDKKDSTNIEMKWEADCKDEAIVEFFNLTYCRAQSTECVVEPIFVNISSSVRSYTIRNLLPFTRYRIEISMHSKTRQGPINVAPIQLTREAEPSAPQNLAIEEIKNTSIILNWNAPEHLNGHIQKFEIDYSYNDQNTKKYIYKKRDYDTTGKITLAPNKSMSYTLDGLNCYTEYKIYIRACTQTCSKNSQSILAKTKIGHPSRLDPPQTSYSNNRLIESIEWSPPEHPNGLNDFYELKIDITKDGVLSSNKSIILKGRHCTPTFSLCVNKSDLYTFSVRAINLVDLNHSLMHYRSRRQSPEIAHTYVDVDTVGVHDVDRDTNLSKRHSNAEIDMKSGLNYIPQQKREEVEQPQQHHRHSHKFLRDTVLECTEEYTFSLEELNDFKNQNIQYLYGEWSVPASHNCNYVQTSILKVMIIVAIFTSFLLIGIFYIACKKFKKMKDIDFELPPGLEDLGDEKAGKSFDDNLTKIEKPSSNGNHHIVNDEQEESLLRSRKESSSNNSVENNSSIDDSENEPNDDEVTTTTQTLSNDIDYMKTTPSKSNILPNDFKSEEFPIAKPIVQPIINKPVTNFMLGSNGYVVQTAPAASMRPNTNGYVMHNAFAKPNSNGYTTLSAAMASQKPIIDNFNGIKTPIVATTGVDENGISGYVTHKQLSVFGHNQMQ